MMRAPERHGLLHDLANLVARTLLGALLVTAGTAAAGVPEGVLSIQLGGRQAVWPLAAGDGDEFCSRFGVGFEEVDQCLVEISGDGKGRLSGSVRFWGSDDGLFYSLAGPLKGSQRGETGNFVLGSYTVKLSGEASDGDQMLPVKASAGVSVDTSFIGLPGGAGSEKICVKGTTCHVSFGPNDPTSLTSGAWTLSLTVVDLGGGKVQGNASASFVDGRRCYYTGRGKHDAARDAVTLDFFGVTPECAGTTLQLRDARWEGALTGQLAWSLFGQRGSAALATLDADFCAIDLDPRWNGTLFFFCD
jgi:hypothetical protein